MDLKKNRKCSLKYFIKNYFLFSLVAVVFFASGFFIFSLEKVFADSINVTQVGITTSPQTINVNTPSSIITVQTQNVDGVIEKVSETTHVILSSNSSNGKFYNANASAGTCTTLLTEPFNITISSGSANKSFCYEDSTPGTYTLTASVENQTWTNATQDITINSSDDTGGSGGDSGDEGEGDDGGNSTPPTYTEITEDISSDTIWTKENGPYVINSEIFVSEGAVLYINEGVIVKFGSGGSLVVEGKIEARGIETDKIYFTSLQDDEVGGDTNNDGMDTYPAVGDWGYILVNSLSEKALFNNVVQRYSNSGLVFYYGSVVELNNFDSDNIITSLSAQGELSNINASGLELYDSSDISVTDSNFRNDDKMTISVYSNSLLNIINSQIEGSGHYVVNIVGSSMAMFDNVSVYANNLNGIAVSVYGESALDFNNGIVESIGSGFEVFNKSILDINNSDLSCGNNGVSVYLDSIVEFLGGSVSAFYNGFELYSEADANIEGVKISDALNAGVVAYNNISSTIDITKNEISDNEYGFIVYGTNFSAYENSIHDNFSFGAMTYLDSDIDFKSNYWGDKTGPTHLSNASGLGDAISDHILYTPFLEYDPLAEKERNPVILIPGITGTYLYKDYGDKEEIWPNVIKMFLPGDDSYLDDLILNEDGTENVEFPIIPGDIIRVISTVHVFDKLIEVLIENGYTEGENLFVFPYDWRFGTEQTASLLNKKIDDILNATGDAKVDIIAHSMGGLVAKKYIADNGSDKIDQLIFLGTPQLGAPKAFKVLMFGDDMSYGFDIVTIKDIKVKIGILSSITAKYISQNMPSVYELLPSGEYVSNNGSYVSNQISESLKSELNYDQTKNLMIEKGRNSLMFPFAENLHSSIDDLDLSNIKSYNFVGCGSDTIGKISLTQKLSWKNLFLKPTDDYELGYTDGDTTVPLVSASKTTGSEMFYVNKISHGALPASQSVINAITALLDDTLITFDDTLQDSDIYCGIEGDVVSVHSPAELHIYDEEGNHVGPDENGDIEYGIPNVSYDVFDEVKYVFLPKGMNYKIITNATDTGGYNFNIEKQEGENIVDSFNWTLIPLKTLDSSGEIWIGPDYPSEGYMIKMDDDGDGDVDNTYSESYDGTSEAEKIVYGNKDKKDHHIASSGSMSNIMDKNIIPRIEKNFDASKRNKNIVMNYIKPDYEGSRKEIKSTQESYEQKNIDKKENVNRYSAFVGGSDTKVSFVWPAIILFSIALILLVKMFIKL